MRKWKRIFMDAGENLTIGLAVALFFSLLNIFRSAAWSLEGIREIVGTMFSESFMVVSILLMALLVYSRYAVSEPVKIAMCCSRKEVFLERQISKLVSGLAVVAISWAALMVKKLGQMETEDFLWLLQGFLLLMLAQGAAEILTILYLRTRRGWIVLVTIVFLSACLGGYVGFTVMRSISNSGFEGEISIWLIQGGPVLGVLLVLIIYHLLAVCSWKMFKNLEVRL